MYSTTVTVCWSLTTVLMGQVSGAALGPVVGIFILSMAVFNNVDPMLTVYI
jgi:hypothetical protein